MFAQAVRTSEAMQEAAQRGGGALIPALSGCRTCRTVQMISAPMLGFCQDCGAELTLLAGSETRRSAFGKVGAPQRGPGALH